MKKVTDAEGSEIDRHYLVKELYKQEDAEFRRDEFAEKIIQYGYLVVRTARILPFYMFPP